MSRKFLVALGFGLLSSCGGHKTKNYEVNGVAQKGPFDAGATIVVQPVNEALAPSGTTINTTTSDKLGDFAIPGTVASSRVEVIANGFYFDEISGGLSGAQLSLRGYSDLSVSSSVHVNVLTHLQGARLAALVSSGTAFAGAEAQSRAEVLAAFHIIGSSLPPASEMDLSQSSDASAVLLCVSLVLDEVAHRRAFSNGTEAAAELSSFLAAMRADLTSDGVVSDVQILAAIRESSMSLDAPAARAHLKDFYAGAGAATNLSQFEQYLDSDGDGVLNKDDAALSPTIFIPGVQYETSFGQALSLVETTSGSVLAAAFPQFYSDNTMPKVGEVLLYSTSGTLVQTLMSPSPATGQGFGAAIGDIGGGRLAVARSDGAEIDVYDALTGGLVTTFASGSNGPWGRAVTGSGGTLVYFATQTGIYGWDIPSHTPVFYLSTPLVASLAIEGDLLAAGMPENLPITAGAAVQLFNRLGNSFAGEVAAPDAAATQFGNSVAMANGHLYVGAPDAPVFGIAGAGAVYDFDIASRTLLNTIPNPSPATSEGFGSSIDVGHGLLVIGSPHDTSPLTLTGGAFVFDLSGTLLEMLPEPDQIVGHQPLGGEAVQVLSAGRVSFSADSGPAATGYLYIFDVP